MSSTSGVRTITTARTSKQKALDKKVLQYAKAKGTVCTNEVARHVGRKWETVQRSIDYLVENNRLFYHPELGRNPKFYSIWQDHAPSRYSDDSQHTEKRESGDDTHDNCARNFPSSQGIVRGAEDQVVENVGFIAHPLTRGKDLPRTFIRAHIHGQYVVEVKAVGRMPETYRVPDTPLTGGWVARRMNGNVCYYGHLKDPNDRADFKFHCMTAKDGAIKSLSVYVHPRYVYYQGNAATASQEFRQQVADITNVLERYGWRFGPAVMRGTYSMGINDRNLASNVPVNHLERSNDQVLYDSSIGSAGSQCTEAEILDNTDTAQDDATLMVELPSRFRSLEASVNAITGILERSIPAQESLTRTVADLMRATDLTTTILLGTPDHAPISPEYKPLEKETKEDVMYG